MEDTIRWSPNPYHESRFLIADASGTRLRYCEATAAPHKTLSYHELARLEELPDFKAFDWSRDNDNLVTIGTTLGETNILQLDSYAGDHKFLYSFPVKQQRECTAVAFNTGTLLATGLKKHRTDSSLNLYDFGNANGGVEPFRRLANSDAVSDVKFFDKQPNTLICGIHSKGVRLYDLRDPSLTGASFASTRQFKNLCIDPHNENYFASAGPSGEPVVSIWDRRSFNDSSGGNFSGSTPVSALDISDAIDCRAQASIRSLRFCGMTSGRLAVLSSMGQLRLFNIGRHLSSESSEEEYNPIGAEENNFYKQSLYLKRSHDLRFSSKDKIRGRNSQLRTLGFDFAPKSLAECESIVALRRDGIVEIIRTSQAPAVVQLSAVSDVILQAQSKVCATIPFRHGSIAEDLSIIQNDIQKRLKEIHANGAYESEEENPMLDAESTTSESYPLDEDSPSLTSRQRHEKLLSLGLPRIALDLRETLTVADTQRRRCEEGYLFDCAKNKGIVKNDPWLVGMWDVVRRLQDLAADLSAGQEMLDLTYAGIHSVWTGSAGRIAKTRHGRHGGDACSELDTILHDFQTRGSHPDFQGVSTAHPTRRMYGLVLCGWIFEEKRLRTKCIEILNRGEPYKAIVTAFCHGRKNVAIDMIKIATRSKLVTNSGLAAVIACDTVSSEQRGLCEWMAEDATDPYLKALLTYFITADWRSVAQMARLPLKYRVAVALQHLDDEALTTFVQATTEDVIKNGDIEGVLLTGIGMESMDLFQNYMDKTGDLQTAVLVNAFAVPSLTDDDRWYVWKENYFHNMQSWRAFVQRTRFTVQHSRRSATQNPNKRIQPPPRQVTLRCTHCQRSIAKPELIANQQGFMKQQLLQSHPSQLQHQSFSSNSSPIPAARPAPSPAQAAGTVCPRCNRHLPRCSLCMLWLGSPDPAYSYSMNGGVAGGGIAAPLAAAVVGLTGSSTAPEDEVGLARFVNFCMECGHGYHANHAREWFAKHRNCPVPDCQCLCVVRR